MNIPTYIIAKSNLPQETFDLPRDLDLLRTITSMRLISQNYKGG